MRAFLSSDNPENRDTVLDVFLQAGVRDEPKGSRTNAGGYAAYAKVDWDEYRRMEALVDGLNAIVNEHGRTFILSHE